MEAKIALLLRFSVFSAATAILCGGGHFLLHHSHNMPDYRSFSNTHSYPYSPRMLLLQVWRKDDLAILQCGLLLLITTPVLRVLYSIKIFTEQNDYLYVGISIIVLLMLLYSLLWHLRP